MKEHFQSVYADKETKSPQQPQLLLSKSIEIGDYKFSSS